MSYFLYRMSKYQGSVAFDCLELTESSFRSYILPQSDASKLNWKIVFEKPSFEQVSCNINVISWSSSTCRENTLRLWCFRCYIQVQERRKITNCGGTSLQRYLFIKLKGKLSKVERSTYHLLQNLWRVLLSSVSSGSISYIYWFEISKDQVTCRTKQLSGCFCVLFAVLKTAQFKSTTTKSEKSKYSNDYNLREYPSCSENITKLANQAVVENDGKAPKSSLVYLWY